jgi:hypothetical protein
VSVTQRDQTGANGVSDGGAGRRYRALPGPAAPWAVPFTLVLGILLVRNAWLFSVPVYEDADLGAYSIQVEQARRFTLLVGNYSREKFNHPGPAFLYVQSWGEDLFYAALRAVPAAWNGQVLALYLLTAFFAASVVAAGWHWGGHRGGLATLGVLGLYGALRPSVFSSPWMPYVYAPAYLALLVSVASVAAGRTRDGWLAALSGWFLIHGHACFLLFVPLLWLSAVASPLAPRVRRRARERVAGRASAATPGHQRNHPRTRLRPSPGRRAWLPVAAISAVFALPLAIELALHWPGNFGKYFAYSGSSQSGGHSIAQVAAYALWFWWPHAGAWAVAAALALAAVAAAWRMPPGPVRRFCQALLAADALSTVAFIAYAATGIDALNQYYIGYFYWSAPVLAILVLALAATQFASSGGPAPASASAAATVTAVIVAATLAACAAFAVAPSARLSTAHADPANPTGTGPVSDPNLPAGVAHIARLAAGRYVVLTIAQHNAWPAVTGLLVEAERTSVRACVVGQNWQFMMTSQFICTPKEIAAGRHFLVWMPGGVPRNMPVVFRLRRGIVTNGPK